MDQSDLDDELELLQSIYPDEINIQPANKVGKREIIMKLRPQTGMDEKKEFVKLDLRVVLPLQYPNHIPVFELFNMRGLDDKDVASFVDDLKMTSENNKGSCVLYQLFEICKERLNQLNAAPRGLCAICLEGFKSKEFMKTPCYHHLHIECFTAYTHYVATANNEDNVLVKVEKKIGPVVYPITVPCPVCREPVETKGYTTQAQSWKKQSEMYTVDYQPTNKMIEEQKWRDNLYQKQMAAGAIIDVEQEKNRHSLDANTPVYVEMHTSISAPTSPGTLKPLENSLNPLHNSRNSNHQRTQRVSHRKKEAKSTETPNALGTSIPSSHIPRSKSFSSITPNYIEGKPGKNTQRGRGKTGLAVNAISKLKLPADDLDSSIQTICTEEGLSMEVQNGLVLSESPVENKIKRDTNRKGRRPTNKKSSHCTLTNCGEGKRIGNAQRGQDKPEAADNAGSKVKSLIDCSRPSSISNSPEENLTLRVHGASAFSEMPLDNMTMKDTNTKERLSDDAKPASSKLSNHTSRKLGGSVQLSNISHQQSVPSSTNGGSSINIQGKNNGVMRIKLPYNPHLSGKERQC